MSAEGGKEAKKEGSEQGSEKGKARQNPRRANIKKRVRTGCITCKYDRYFFFHFGLLKMMKLTLK